MHLKILRITTKKKEKEIEYIYDFKPAQNKMNGIFFKKSIQRKAGKEKKKHLRK